MKWPSYPVVYEINTLLWLKDLSEKCNRNITFGNIPDKEYDTLRDLGFDAVWFMGVWERSSGALQAALANNDVMGACRSALPGFNEADVVASPYAVLSYNVDDQFGGNNGLERLRAELAARGILLMLDFVPNHFAVDHQWLSDFPQRLMRGDTANQRNEPKNYFVAPGTGDIFAHGRDPNYNGWDDTVQIDYRLPETRSAICREVMRIAEKCDGIRCDMAMLVTNQIFSRTWGNSGGARYRAFYPVLAEFWPHVVTEAKASYPDFLMIGEIYRDLEWLLQCQGLDFAYDKKLYDRLRNGDIAGVNVHLRDASLEYASRLVRFIENHDEPRAVRIRDRYGNEDGIRFSKAAAMATLALPGFRLIHHGQIEGYRTKLPVQLGRHPQEQVSDELASFYKTLLKELREPVFHEGDWEFVSVGPAWDTNPTFGNFIAYLWKHLRERRLVVVNLGEDRSQCHVPCSDPGFVGKQVALLDAMTGTIYQRDGDELNSSGMYVDLERHGYHLFRYSV